MGSHLIRTILAAGLIATPVAAQGQSKDSCQSLLRRGGKVIDTYVMDFGTGDKLYVHIARMPGGQTTKCTTRKPL
ncbi:hypothetical protein FZC33_30900 [Labrys sp. KNU-23]|uniref:hypothetical protein n=1 Tax=Labrys sp. KNU-23 TaxID=2789216 RepID=UPI0011EF4F04|nr:hypothetical protein [Labrys sp. KNU-23]QEN90451.1 hypothetical protein FZC33_30900 [Labrys sp. KNU-23]